MKYCGHLSFGAFRAQTGLKSELNQYCKYCSKWLQICNLTIHRLTNIYPQLFTFSEGQYGIPCISGYQKQYFMLSLKSEKNQIFFLNAHLSIHIYSQN